MTARSTASFPVGMTPARRGILPVPWGSGVAALSDLLDPFGLEGLGAEEGFFCRPRIEIARGFWEEWNHRHPDTPMDDDDFGDAVAQCAGRTTAVRQRCPPGKPEEGRMINAACLQGFWNRRAECKYKIPGTPAANLIPGDNVACKKPGGGISASSAGSVFGGDFASAFSSVPTWLWYALGGVVVLGLVAKR